MSVNFIAMRRLTVDVFTEISILFLLSSKGKTILGTINVKL